MSTFTLLTFLVLLVCCCFSTLLTKADSCGTPSDGPVLKGIDLVDLRQGYEQNGVASPQTGLSEYSYSILGYEFWFMSQTNLNLFSGNVTGYLPAYVMCYMLYF